jgi:hypothetical protein
VKRRKVKAIERSFRLETIGIVPHEQRSVDQMNVRLDATEALLQCVREWMAVLVIIVRMSANERPGCPDFLTR